MKPIILYNQAQGFGETFPDLPQDYLDSLYDSAYVSYRKGGAIQHWAQGRDIAMLKRHAEIARSLILEIGCGTGEFIMSMMGAGCRNVIAMDTSATARKLALKRYGFVVLPVLPQIDNQVDVIVMRYVLEHLTLAQANKLLQDCKKLLKPKGVLFIKVPRFRSFMRHVPGLFPKTTHLPHHRLHFARHGLKAYMERSGFKTLELRGQLRLSGVFQYVP